MPSAPPTVPPRAFPMPGCSVSVVGTSSSCDCDVPGVSRSEEHTSELQSQFHLVCRLLLEKKNTSFFLASRARYCVDRRHFYFLCPSPPRLSSPVDYVREACRQFLLSPDFYHHWLYILFSI